MVKITRSIYTDSILISELKARGFSISAICNNALEHEVAIPFKESIEIHKSDATLFDSIIGEHNQNLSEMHELDLASISVYIKVLKNHLAKLNEKNKELQTALDTAKQSTAPPEPPPPSPSVLSEPSELPEDKGDIEEE